ncbi:hypothetical protein V1478_010546 [Vespula squamosa]|uniref:Uncharacterized protein n=1 Tax=Vespula squamosa TaxID=30214 RepID=A0ABD2AK99_VESSQ
MRVKIESRAKIRRPLASEIASKRTKKKDGNRSEVWRAGTPSQTKRRWRIGDGGRGGGGSRGGGGGGDGVVEVVIGILNLEIYRKVPERALNFGLSANDKERTSFNGKAEANGRKSKHVVD